MHGAARLTEYSTLLADGLDELVAVLRRRLNDIGAGVGEAQLRRVATGLAAGAGDIDIEVHERARGESNGFGAAMWCTQDLGTLELALVDSNGLPLDVAALGEGRVARIADAALGPGARRAMASAAVELVLFALAPLPGRLFSGFLVRLLRLIGPLGLLGCRRTAVAAGDGNAGAVHVELLLAIDPRPGKDGGPRRNIGRDVEVQNMVCRVDGVVFVVLRTIALPGLQDPEGFALVGADADLTRSASMCAAPRVLNGAVDPMARDGDVCRLSGGPCRDGLALWLVEEAKMSFADAELLRLSAASFGVVELRICLAFGCEGVVVSEKCRWPIQMHVCLSSA